MAHICCGTLKNYSGACSPQSKASRRENVLPKIDQTKTSLKHVATVRAVAFFLLVSSILGFVTPASERAHILAPQQTGSLAVRLKDSSHSAQREKLRNTSYREEPARQAAKSLLILALAGFGNSGR